MGMSHFNIVKTILDIFYSLMTVIYKPSSAWEYTTTLQIGEIDFAKEGCFCNMTQETWLDWYIASKMEKFGLQCKK